MSGGHFLGRGRFPRILDAALGCGQNAQIFGKGTVRAPPIWVVFFFAVRESKGREEKCPGELYECGIPCYSLAFCGWFPRFFYDMVTPAQFSRPALRQAAKHSHGAGHSS